VGVASTWLAAALSISLIAGSEPPTTLGDLGCLSGTRHTLSRILPGVAYSAGIGLGLLVILVLMRVIVRRQWAAVAATIALVTSLGAVGFSTAGGEKASAILFCVLLATGPLLITQVGLLAFVVGSFLWLPCMLFLPVTLELSAWYAQPTWVFLLVVAGLTLYGFYVSLGGRPMFGEKLLEE
jgi:hypothetical protein